MNTKKFFGVTIKSQQIAERHDMKDKIIEILVRLAHLSEKTKAFADELDKIYELLGEQAFLDLIKTQEQK